MLDHRGEFRALRHQHANSLDDDVVDLESALVGNEPPIDLNRCFAVRADDVRRDDSAGFVRSRAANSEFLATETRQTRPIHKHYVVLEELQKFLLLLLASAAPITT